VSVQERSLCELRVGDTAEVSRIETPDGPDAQRLLTLGLCPGAQFRVEQTYPAVVVGLAGGVVAMEDSVARSVYVRPVRSAL